MPGYRNVSAERRERAAACVNRHLDTLHAILETEPVARPHNAKNGRARVRIVEGSAVAAEVYLAETNTIHTAVRVAVLVAPRDRAATERALRDHAFASTEPSGDARLLQMAAHAGRRAIHVLIDQSVDDGDGDGPHPGDPRSRRRFDSAWLPLASAYRRVEHLDGEDQHATESFEVQIIERPHGSEI